MIFKSRKEIMERAQKYEEAEDDQDAVRDMNDYEKELMKKFEENDAEIDEMLDVVINQLEKLRGHAEGIGTAIRN